jgi:hypothetical protein
LAAPNVGTGVITVRVVRQPVQEAKRDYIEFSQSGANYPQCQSQAFVVARKKLRLAVFLLVPKKQNCDPVECLRYALRQFAISAQIPD